VFQKSPVDLTIGKFQALYFACNLKRFTGTECSIIVNQHIKLLPKCNCRISISDIQPFSLDFIQQDPAVKEQLRNLTRYIVFGGNSSFLN